MFHLYGLIIGIGIILGYRLFQKRIRNFGLKKEDLDKVFFCVSVGAMIGARLYHVLDFDTYYSSHPLEVFYLWNGGLAIYGALLGGFLALFVYLFKENKLDRFVGWMDALSPGVLLSQAIGRWGNFVNVESYGPQTNLPWSLYLVSQNQYVHPLFLYESLWNILGVFLLLKYFTKPKIPGLSLGFYLLWYPLGRFFIEFLRTDTATFGNFKVAQLLSLFAILIGVCTMKRGYENSRR